MAVASSSRPFPILVIIFSTGVVTVIKSDCSVRPLRFLINPNIHMIIIFITLIIIIVNIVVITRPHHCKPFHTYDSSRTTRP